MATTSNAPRRLTRDQAAEELLKLLTDEPQSAAALRRKLFNGRTTHGGSSDVTALGLGVLDARHKAKRIPRSPGQSGGWVRFGSAHDAAIEPLDDVAFPYEWGVVHADHMFVDESYQRPLTSFVDKITRNFDPILFQVLALSDRGTKNKPRRYAVIDGQTRWVGATRRGVVNLPSIIFRNLTPEQEADIFARLQKERKGMVSWHRFRADLRAGKAEALAIKKMVENTGFVLGDGVGQLKAVGALEACYRRDAYTLERVLSDLMDAWPDQVPEAPHIRGLHYFFRQYPIEKRGKHEDVDDERLVRRLKTNNPDTLKRKALIAKEAAIKGGSAEKFMGLAIEKIYATGG